MCSIFRNKGGTLTDEEFNQRFAIQQGAARFWVLTVIVILFLSALIWWVSLAQADETCPVAKALRPKSVCSMLCSASAGFSYSA